MPSPSTQGLDELFSRGNLATVLRYGPSQRAKRLITGRMLGPANKMDDRVVIKWLMVCKHQTPDVITFTRQNSTIVFSFVCVLALLCAI